MKWLRQDRKQLAVVLALAAVPLFGCAQEEPAAPTPRQKNKAVVQKAYEENLKRSKDNPDVMVRPGLAADRKEKRVHLLAEATGFPTYDAIEFFLISEESGRDYEALAVSFAKPSDVHEALVFVGSRPGCPVNPSKLRLWPKGERVNVTFEWDAAASTNAKAGRVRARAEELILDKRTHKPLPLTGLVFAGSFVDEIPGQPGKRGYVADFSDPNSIASDFNEFSTVLDVPRQAEKSSVYLRQLMNPAFTLIKGQLVDVYLEPEYKDGRRRVMDLTLNARAKTGSAPALSLADLAISLSDPDGSNVIADADMKDAVAFFENAVNRGHDPFVTLVPGSELSLQALAQLCSLLAAIEGEKGIRMDPPPEGHVFYKAFVPNERFRERATRPTQPWELYLSPAGNSATGVLNQVEEIWDPDGKPSTFKVTSFPVPSPAALHELLAEKEGLRVVLIFAPGPMSYGTLLPLAQAAMKTHPTLYVFLPADAVATKGTEAQRAPSGS